MLAASACLLAQDAPPRRRVIHVVVRAFIPNEHTGNPGYVKAVQGVRGLFVIPSLSADCIASDDRDFSIVTGAASRVTTEFLLITQGDSATVATLGARELNHLQPVRTVDCESGREIGAPRTPAAEGMRVEAITFDGTLAQADFSVRLKNPLALQQLPATADPEASLDYGGTVTFNTMLSTVRFRGFVDVFPAFEAFVESETSGMKILFQIPPAPATTIADLYDAPPGTKTRAVDVTVALTP
jgi:hypothetical protein